ncbi:MAG: hypothetical protein J7J31_03825 [Helicobacteraceae bacterium]|nr:hypothetical protein [Helicobacteraceae bacterium]
MARTKTTSIQLPRGAKKSNEMSKLSNHFDNVNSLLANEHYGKYLIVQNSKSDPRSHNRQYFCFDSMIEFISVAGNNGLINSQKERGITNVHLLSRFPQHSKFIRDSIFTFIEPFTPRADTGNLLKGFGHFLMVLNNINWETLESINGNHLKMIEQDAKKNDYSKSTLENCTRFCNKLVSVYDKNLKVPKYTKYASVTNSKNELSLAVSWQCDIYACEELDGIMHLVNEYEEWMNELKAMQEIFSKEELSLHGGLFTLKNLIYTYFDNIDQFGRVSGPPNRVIRSAAYCLYGIKLNEWKNSRRCTEHEVSLRKKGEGGLNISIQDERMFAIWHKVIAPEYPFVSDILPQYSFVQKNLGEWRRHVSKKFRFSLRVFDSRVYPDLRAIYPLYLLSLCRSGLNQQPVKDWRIWKDEDGGYHLGENSGMGRIVDGFKGRGNTIQSTALDHQQCKYVDFWCKYAKPLFNNCDNNYFFTFGNNNAPRTGKIEINAIDTSALRSMFYSKTHFFYQHNITDRVYQNDGTYKEKRLYSINHEKIRKVKNLSAYLEGKEQWERQFRLGHKDAKTEITYQKAREFQGSKQHRISITMNELLAFFKDKSSVKENPKFEIFTGPLSNCINPSEPDYIGVKKLRDGDVCVNWRKCLTKCSQSDVVKEIHGPNIMAWQNVMEELRSLYPNEEWEKFFLLDNMAAEAALEMCKFTNEERIECELKAKQSGRVAFIRKEVLNSQRVRRLSLKEKDNA